MPGFDYSKFDHIDFSDSEEEVQEEEKKAYCQMLLEEVTTLRKRVNTLEKEKKAWHKKPLEKIVISKRTEYIIISPLPTADEMTKQAADAAQKAAGDAAQACGPAHVQPSLGNSITGDAPATIAQVMAALEAFGNAIDDTFVKKMATPQLPTADEMTNQSADAAQQAEGKAASALGVAQMQQPTGNSITGEAPAETEIPKSSSPATFSAQENDAAVPTQKHFEKKSQLESVERTTIVFAVKLIACLKSLLFPVIALAAGGGMMVLAPSDAIAMVGKLIFYLEAQSIMNIFLSWALHSRITVAAGERDFPLHGELTLLQ